MIRLDFLNKNVIIENHEIKKKKIIMYKMQEAAKICQPQNSLQKIGTNLCQFQLETFHDAQIQDQLQLNLVHQQSNSAQPQSVSKKQDLEMKMKIERKQSMHPFSFRTSNSLEKIDVFQEVMSILIFVVWDCQKRASLLTISFSSLEA